MRNLKSFKFYILLMLSDTGLNDECHRWESIIIITTKSLRASARVSCAPPAAGTPHITFVLVGIQQVLKLCVEDLQVFLYEDLLTLPGQFILGGFMKVNLHTPLLF